MTSLFKVSSRNCTSSLNQKTLQQFFVWSRPLCLLVNDSLKVSSVDELPAAFQMATGVALDQLAPSVCQERAVRPVRPWLTQELTNEQSSLHHLEQQWKHFPSEYPHQNTCIGKVVFEFRQC